MESILTMGHQPSNSTEEVDHQDEDAVRSYECVFCKRGFTTAQALGGHMNIHRKDRAKGNRPNYDHLSNSNSISSKQEEYHSSYSGPRVYEPVFASYPSSYVSASRSDDQEGLVHYTTYLSPTSRSVRPINLENNHQDVHGVITSPSSFSLKFGWSHDQDPKRAINGGGNEEDELDLELRLGHDP